MINFKVISTTIGLSLLFSGPDSSAARARVTGRSATLESDGRSFEDIAADRLSKPNDAVELAGVQL